MGLQTLIPGVHFRSSGQNGKKVNYGYRFLFAIWKGSRARVRDADTKINPRKQIHKQ